MKLTSTQRTAVIAASAVALVTIAAVAWWIITSRKRNNGLVVIGANTNTQNSTGMNQEQNHFNDTSLPLGYRNNNPLNILCGASLWKGKVMNNTDTSKPRKEQFISMAYGYRAALYLLRKYIRSGCNTLARMVNRWGSGANTDKETSYVKFVASKSGIAPGTVIDANDSENLCKVAYAMAWFENGKAPSSMDEIYEGWSLL